MRHESSEDPYCLEGKEKPLLGDTPPEVSVPDASLKPFVRALLALAIELEDRKEHRQ